MRSGSLCALLWRLLSWCNLREICLRACHIPGRLNVIADKLSRHHQVIQTEWSLHLDIFAQICHRWHLPKVDLFATRYNRKLPQFVSLVPNPCIEPVMGGSVYISTNSRPHKCPDKGSQLSVPKEDNSCPRLVKYALVLGSGGDVIPNTSLSSKPPGSPDSAFQRKPSQGSAKSEPSCLASRAKFIQEQGFSDQVATRIEAPQRWSTRFVYEAKWAVFVRWCKAHQVDFHSPSVEQIANFLLHLFQNRRLPRGIPSWNLPLVLHQLTKAPFEPL